ncbi:MAG TPA: ATP-binding protein [Bryobacterales bacterium]|jgi:DNA replication protein DnaC|nr:ATP-binding protein [Bryobacterales bacterium]
MPDPNCALCDGTGWKPVERGEVSGVERCECNQSLRPAQLLQSARIPPRFEKASFENFRLPDRRENPVANEALSKSILDAKVFSREYPLTEKPGLMFMGLPGVGKTHLAVAVLKVLLEKGFEGLFVDYQSLLEGILASYDRTVGSGAREAYQDALDAEILLIDDLGARRLSEWAEDTVFSIINHRYNARKATIVTTNLPDEAVGDKLAEKERGSGQYRVRDSLADRIGSRARSRLFEMCKLIRITATEDYRLRGVRAPQ